MLTTGEEFTAAELRAWLLELRSSLAPESIAGYVRGLKAFGNWCVAEELAVAPGFRALRRPHVPRRFIAPFSDAELRSLWPWRTSASGRLSCSSSTPDSDFPSSCPSVSATCANGRTIEGTRPRGAACKVATGAVAKVGGGE